MRLDQIIRGIAIADRRGFLNADIHSLAFDSRAVDERALFVAVPGTKSDGHTFIAEALERGAPAVIAERWSKELDEIQGRPQVVLVSDTRRALALIASNFYGQPSRKLLVSGVTGTNGKTTVTYVLESIIKAASRKVGLIGTVECRYAGISVPVQHTTPDPVTVKGLMAKMRDAGVTHVVMEVSSHALAQDRVTGIHFKVCGFTNLTQDHLDYHSSMEKYFHAKASLFSDVLRKSRARGRMAIVNVDDPKGEELIAIWGGKTLRVSTNPDSEAEVVALEAEFSLEGTKAKVRTPKGIWDLEIPLIGAHNLSNTLVAVGMALAMGFSKPRIVRGLRALERVPGRLEAVPNDAERRVFVDYAHTPDALNRVLTCLKPLTRGRLIVVFGCGGDRDKEKRGPMGRAVAEMADLAVVTNDNPRSEDPSTIANAVVHGLAAGGFTRMGAEVRSKAYLVELERRAAIKTALRWQTADDVVVIAGKGHETHQIIQGQTVRFEDREEARRILAGEPPPPPEVLSFDDHTGEVEASQVLDEAEVADASIVAEQVAEQVSEATAEVAAEDIEAVQVSGEVHLIEEKPEIIEEADVAQVIQADDAVVEARSAAPVSAEAIEADATDIVEETMDADAEVVDEQPLNADPPEEKEET